MNTTQVDDRSKKAAEKLKDLDKNSLKQELSSSEKIPLSRSTTNQTLTTATTSTTDDWVCLQSNIDMIWGFYYAEWYNSGIYSWDAINGNGTLKW